MSYVEESVNAATQHSSSNPTSSTPSKTLVQDALDANKQLQQILLQRAAQLEAKLKEADQLLAAATIEESQDEPEPEIFIPGAKKATGLFPSSDLLDPASPFYEEAIKRSNYLNSISPHPLKAKDVEVLSNAVRQENERLKAYNTLHIQDSASQGPFDLQNNITGLDWSKIAEKNKVSDASSVKRTAVDCRITWLADKHPSVNHSEWSEDELNALNTLISQYSKEKKAVDWVNVAEKLGTNRIPIDCMKHGIPRHRHNWSPEADQKLIHAVESCGHDNWQLVARRVSEHVSAGQCQNRWQKTLNPTLRKGAWTEDEDERLRKAVAGYGSSWIQVATAIPGRTNDQCRERWLEHVNNTSGKAAWTPEEDKLLLDLVKERGNQWKQISLQIGNSKTGQNCRLRHDKLKRMEKTSQLNPVPYVPVTQAHAGPSRLIGDGGSASQDMPMMSPSTNLQEISSNPDIEPVISIITRRPKPRAKGKGKEKASASNQGAEGLPQPVLDGDGDVDMDASNTTVEAVSGSALTEDNSEPISQARPKPRPKGNTAKQPVSAEPPASENYIEPSEPAPVLAVSAGEDPPRPNTTNVVGKPKSTVRAKRKATDTSADIAELPKSKRAKASATADPKPSLLPSNAEASMSAADSRIQTLEQDKGPKKRGRPRKVVAIVEGEREPTPSETAPGTPTADTDIPSTETGRRKSTRLTVASKP